MSFRGELNVKTVFGWWERVSSCPARIIFILRKYRKNAAWAIFDCIGPVPQAIQKGWKYLNEEWLVKYPFQHAQCPEVEWYSNGNAYDSSYLSQIWIPIVEEE